MASFNHFKGKVCVLQNFKVVSRIWWCLLLVSRNNVLIPTLITNNFSELASEQRSNKTKGVQTDLLFDAISKCHRPLEFEKSDLEFK
jgi:hypothetical protein